MSQGVMQKIFLGGVIRRRAITAVIKTVDVDLSKYPKITRSGTITLCLKDCIRKIDQCGKAICLLCRKANPMKYGTNEVADLTKRSVFWSCAKGG